MKAIMSHSRFPLADPQTAVQEGRKFVNSGGWIGVASRAGLILQELAHIVQGRPDEEVCHQCGTDQLLGNAAYLRFPSLIGLDADYQFFAGGSWNLINQELTWQQTTNGNNNNANNKAYCRSKTNNCPAFLHFNGGGSEGGVLQEAFDKLTSSDALPTCPPEGGSVTIVNLDTSVTKTLLQSRVGHSSRMADLCARQSLLWLVDIIHPLVQLDYRRPALCWSETDRRDSKDVQGQKMGRWPSSSFAWLMLTEQIHMSPGVLVTTSVLHTFFSTTSVLWLDMRGRTPLATLCNAGAGMHLPSL